MKRALLLVAVSLLPGCAEFMDFTRAQLPQSDSTIPADCVERDTSGFRCVRRDPEAQRQKPYFVWETGNDRRPADARSADPAPRAPVAPAPAPSQPKHETILEP